ncbi:MAG: hypothetical protein JHD35_08185 [Sphingopyxis sp.]|nr:hypothetical protein [Sphingopyxis sp.]
MAIKKSLLAAACLIAGCSEAPEKVERPVSSSEIAEGAVSPFEDQVTQIETEMGSQSSKDTSASPEAKPYLVESDLLSDKEAAAIDNAKMSPQAKALLAAVLIAENRDKRLGIKRTSMEDQIEQFRKKHDEDARSYAKEHKLEKARAEAEEAAARERDQLRDERRRAAMRCKDRKEIEILRYVETTGSPPNGAQDRTSSFWAECNLENL